MTNDCNAIICTDKCKEPIVVKIKKKKKIGRAILLDIKAYYKATVIKEVWCWCKDEMRVCCNIVEFKNKPMHLLKLDYMAEKWRWTVFSIKHSESTE